MTGDADRQALLQIARCAIVAHVTRLPLVPSDLTGTAARPGGAFVSLHAHGRLRGCIGHIEATLPLGRVVARCAIAAASADPRFPPVVAEELSAVAIELSLLGALEPIDGVDAVEIGRHGLLIERGVDRGLLLPQVATEWKWDRETFLARACHKAGLPPDAWRRGAKLWRFEAEVFGEAGA